MRNLLISNFYIKEGLTCLHYAAQGGFFGIVEFLIETVHLEVNNRSKVIFSRTFMEGATVYYYFWSMFQSGLTPLLLACREGNTNIVNYLSACGADYTADVVMNTMNFTFRF